MRQKVLLAFIILLAALSLVHAQTRKTHWVDSVFNNLDDGRKDRSAVYGNRAFYMQVLMLSERIENEIKTHK